MIEPVNNIPSFTQLSEEKALASIRQTPDELKEVAEQFEAIFLNFFLKQARAAKLAEDPLSNSASDTYRDMLDQEYATSLSGDVDLGIAEGLMRQFGRFVG
ncbi:MAG: rod-binding protein [Alphaproteobacteria bacterium]|jgi:peptidoglycan hydrolase FlgJ|nr:rod-binding protein [Alphaproteobacteria bacterium]MDG2466468.1 rod-binding protein [Alphaproteobacteria bacterium]